MAEVNFTLGEHQFDGECPVVIVGANGVGKSTIGNQVARSLNGEWISATRNLSLPDQMDIKTLAETQKNLNATKNSAKANFWSISSETHSILNHLKAEGVQAAVTFMEQSRHDPTARPPKTRIQVLCELWASVFPQRSLDLTTYNAQVISATGGTNARYQVSRMSGGERVALYLLARAVDAKPGLVVVDEPEIHLHRRLAQEFWDVVEAFRSDCRFLYLTHDIGFALSRRNARHVILREKNKPVVVPEGDTIPPDVMEALLGTSTLSIAAKRIVFCEGNEKKVSDYSLYNAWFNDDDTVVCPVESCESVINHTEVFNSNTAIVGLTAIGIMDRDYRPEAFLADLQPNVHVLDVHEMEGHYCRREVFAAVAKHQAIPDAEIQNRYDKAIAVAKEQFTGIAKNKHVLIRAKQRMEFELRALTNPLAPNADCAVGQVEFCAAFDVAGWAVQPADIYQQEIVTIEGAISGTAEEFVKIMPSKSIIGHLANELGIHKGRYVELVCHSLNPPTDEAVEQLKQLGADLVTALSGHLPQRKS